MKSTYKYRVRIKILIGIVREADPGEPLTSEDFEYAESAEFQNEIANEEDHDEDGSASLFEGDIEMSDAEQRQALMERGIPGLREVYHLDMLFLLAFNQKPKLTKKFRVQIVRLLC